MTHHDTQELGGGEVFFLQRFLADSTVKAAADLEAALLQLPEDRRGWSAGGEARSALHMVAECAIMNGSAVAMIERGVFPEDFAHVHFASEIAALARDWATLQRRLHESAAHVAQVIRQVPRQELPAQADSMAYPFWNMSYHLGQINFIASLLAASSRP